MKKTANTRMKSGKRSTPPPEPVTHQWTFLSNHAHVVVCLSRDSTLRLRDLAQLVGITERGIHRVLSELEEARVVEKFRDGRRNYYKVNASASLRHPLEHHTTVGELIALLGPG